MCRGDFRWGYFRFIPFSFLFFFFFISALVLFLSRVAIPFGLKEWVKRKVEKGERESERGLVSVGKSIHISSIYTSMSIVRERVKEPREKRAFDYFKAECRWIGCRNAGLLFLDLYSAPPGRHFHFRKKEENIQRMRKTKRRKIHFSLLFSLSLSLFFLFPRLFWRLLIPFSLQG